MKVKGAGKALLLWIVALSVVSLGAASQGARFAGQAIVGTAGGALMGLVGHWIGTRICEITAEEGTETTEHCWLPGAYGYLAGVPLGTSLGVVLAGYAFGMQGDHLLAAAGAVVGEALGVGILAMLWGTLGDEEATFAAAYGLVPFFSASFAATGYNLRTDKERYVEELEGMFLAFAMSGIAPTHNR